MEISPTVLSIIVLMVVFVFGALLRGFLPAYFTEKGKNLASKEDVTHLTDLVEKVKALHTSEIEHLKANLLAEAQVIERRRHVYEEVCAALRIFITGHGNSAEAKDHFHASYSVAWLWASDSVLEALNIFVKRQIQFAADPSSIDQNSLKEAYAAIILAMRRDVGFVGTNVDGTNYQFVQF